MSHFDNCLHVTLVSQTQKAEAYAASKHFQALRRTLTASAATAAIDNMITNHGKGNPELVNLPRKINIGLATTRDDFAHTHINDVGLYAAKDPETGKVQCPFLPPTHPSRRFLLLLLSSLCVFSLCILMASV